MVTTPPQSRLTKDLILDHALRLADAEGAPAIGMRRLARELDVTPMALYWHFKTKEQLLDAVADRIFAEVDRDLGRGGWRTRFERLLRAVLAVVRDHPSAAELLAGSGGFGEHQLAVQESALEVLRQAGLTPEQAANVSGHALTAILGMVRSEPGRSRAGVTSDEEQRRLQARLAALPPDRFPRIVEAAGPLSRCDDPDAYDEFGLSLLLAGVERLADPPRRR
ncbi:TetR/AcrR family transcriptional regulator [Microlunatus sp. GCM10028923]|uniref:TetR/AcrR family transcriptional regulator n=1 Tax=Microlunatus sp. GCM10028923 TaxID=3273400 RepID=UPI003609FDE2